MRYTHKLYESSHSSLSLCSNLHLVRRCELPLRDTAFDRNSRSVEPINLHATEETTADGETSGKQKLLTCDGKVPASRRDDQ